MRTLIRVTLADVATANKAFKEGSLQKTIDSVAGRLKPEAMYYHMLEGKRSFFMICQMTDSSQIPIICEPFFIDFNAEIEFFPVMNADDLEKGVAEYLKNK